ncbi:MAG: hypothetical protein EOO26_00025 [Comamonadaceae bacterium]|nr:MAG: hypothetical protein EOO26_00025 [Comamonadaceae bacterium]
MTQSFPTDVTSDRLVSCFWQGDAMRSRSVGTRLLSAALDVPAPPVRLLADWERELSLVLALTPGDVESLPLARARMRWPGYKDCVRTVADWTRSLGLGDVLAASDVALMACRGARYHHDGEQYGGAAFCNLFVSEDKGLDLHFAATGIRIPLVRGTVVIFDTCQPHAVIRRGSQGFDAADFETGPECTQVFLTWELPVVAVATLMQIAFDTDRSAASTLRDEQLLLNGARGTVCPASGRWIRA